MAKKNSGRLSKYWYNVYRLALRYIGVELRKIKHPTMKSVGRARKLWKQSTKGMSDIKLREVYRQEVSIEKEQSDYMDTPRDNNMRTENPKDMYDAALDKINSFIDRVEAIYQDTLAYIDTAINNEEGATRLAALGRWRLTDIARAKSNLMKFIEKMARDAEGNYDLLAQALSADKELDYTIAITEQPPSDVEILFEVTLANLQAIWDSINKGINTDVGETDEIEG